jgi:hypothetical protein
MPSPGVSSPGLGPIRPVARPRPPEPEPAGTGASTSAGAGASTNGDTELPVLPARVPGRSYADLRTGGNGVASEDAEQPPPLPQRRGSHLREELLEPPAPTKPVPGHNPSLMKTVLEGRDHWLAEQNRDAGRQQNQGPTKGDSAPWPTT